MNGTQSPSDSPLAPSLRWMSWSAVAVFGLVWVELISRLRFEWSINPQYGYGWTVPFLAAYIFWRRCQTAPPPSRSTASIVPSLLILAAALFLIPVRLIQ